MAGLILLLLFAAMVFYLRKIANSLYSIHELMIVAFDFSDIVNESPDYSILETTE